ncbi:hypothetical protein T484DRAFT_1770837 [Baffinella frigidus]|nr:hypothetical protein T484DRAFT_1770837 [Cryptophyta sp. CCMP2293]
MCVSRTLPAGWPLYAVVSHASHQAGSDGLGAKLPTATWLAAKINVEGGLRSVVANAAPKNAEDLPALFFAHGFLGSRFDMLHVAEALASQG